MSHRIGLLKNKFITLDLMLNIYAKLVNIYVKSVKIVVNQLKSLLVIGLKRMIPSRWVPQINVMV